MIEKKVYDNDIRGISEFVTKVGSEIVQQFGYDGARYIYEDDFTQYVYIINFKDSSEEVVKIINVSCDSVQSVIKDIVKHI